MPEALEELTLIDTTRIFVADSICFEHAFDFLLVLSEEKSDIEFFFWDSLE